MINYKHLHYFWVVANHGSITKACETLHLTPQTISGQLSQLEAQMDVKLFTKVGRNLKLTESGQLVLEYAEEIFSTGEELEEMLRILPEEHLVEFRVGVLDSVPKSIAYRLLAPALDLSASVKIVCTEGGMEELLLDLAVHKIDLVLADCPIPKNANVKGFNHPLGECGISFFANDKIKSNLNKPFPANLDNKPMLIPSSIANIHAPLLGWFKANDIKPIITGEFDDTALMKTFGRGGTGIFTAPSAIAKQVERDYGVSEIGSTTDILESFYAITVKRKIIHPAVIAITESAKKLLF
jgi:LysR family transcriptional activator of nhaA